MEKSKRVLLSSAFESDIFSIFEYGGETFGLVAAEKYREQVLALTFALPDYYLMYPECKHTPTKSRIYRNIILESHLIIYRIKTETIEVLRVLNSRSSISRIRTSRKVKP